MISLNLVKDYIDIENENINELTKKITEFGINIEKVISKHIDNVVIGEVKTCVNHPDSDHLHILLVDVGDYSTQIVCGAQNVREGLKVIVALPGAILPGDFVIKKSKIRGVESNGMICALFELGLEEKTEENYNKGIAELESDAPVGVDALKYLGLDDTLLELDIHKHRNNDCFYHIGFAYIIGAILRKKVNLPKSDFTEISDNINDKFSLKVETDNCPYYLAKMVTDIKVKSSPEFIKKRLLEVGMRPINNVVDISNYVMLEYGGPMHFFDYDKLGNNITVRMAKDNEKITTLDKVERSLTTSDIVITDGNKPVCLAGVMGGLDTEVTTDTKTVIIESAIFSCSNIRNTANKYNLYSEAAIRYFKPLNYEYTQEAINRACHLLEKYADAKILTGILKHDKIDKSPKIVEFFSKEISSILGITINDNDVEDELKRLDFSYTKDNNKFIVTIPGRRLDIDTNVNDIAEEIGKLYGYHNLKSTLPVVPIKKGEYIGDVKIRKQVSKYLRGLGLNECKTYTLVSKEMATKFNYDNKECLNLPNPMSSDKSVLRESIIPSLLNTYSYNKTRKVKDIMLYEISKVYDVNYKEDSKIAVLMSGNYISSEWNNNKITVDFYLIKAILESLLNYLGFKNRYTFKKDIIPDMHPGMSAKILLDRKDLGIIGRVHPLISKDDIFIFEISMNALKKSIKPIKFKEASIYPEINKDLAFIVDKKVSAEELIKTIKMSGGRLLKDIKVFDVYMGENLKENEKSIAFSLTFGDITRTLTDEEVMDLFNKIIKSVEDKNKAILRDK